MSQVAVRGAPALLGVTALVALSGCPRRPPEPPPDPPVEVDPEQAYRDARARELPEVLRARFQVRLRSEPLEVAGTTGGALVIARPGAGRVDILGPLGGTLASMTGDGVGLSLLVPGERHQLLAEDAEVSLREATGGAVGLDDLFAILMGDLPLAQAPVDAYGQVEGFPGVILAGPEGSRVHVVLDPEQATPRSLRATDAQGELLLSVVYHDFAWDEEAWLPAGLELYVPVADLEAVLRYRRWEALQEGPALSLEAPPGFTTEPLLDALEQLAREQDDL